MDAKSSPPTIPEFEPTDVPTIAEIAGRLRATFDSRRTRNVDYRLVQLRRLCWALTDFEKLLLEALYRDLHKSPYEALLTELDFVREECIFAITHLKRWARDERIDGFPLPLRVFGHKVRKEPIGPALIIGTYNYPVLVSLGPLVGAIAAGCPAVLKPSENAPWTAAAMAHIVAERLDPDAYAVVNGAVEHATALLDVGDDPGLRWGKIFYTGNYDVARVIARRAAETLTPCVFELGGSNPAIVTRHADLAVAARRLMWCTVLNAGQVCVKQNYILVERAVQEPFVEAVKKSLADFFPEGARGSPDYARVVNQRHFQRITGILARSRGRVVVGGEADKSELFIEPTVVLVDSEEDSTMREEAFGPVTALMPFDTLDEAIGIVNKVSPTSLALFTFGSDSENEQVLGQTCSGGATVNDSFMHAALTPAPFGGIGSSGTGLHRGKASFDAFTHCRTLAHVPGWADIMLRARYMPYNPVERRLLRATVGSSVDFDRDGRVVRGFRWWATLLLKLAGVGALLKALAAVATRVWAGA